MALKSQVQLITYADSLGGSLRALHATLTGPFAGLFGGVHILPFFPSSGDRGFSPTSYDTVDPSFGDWNDVERIAAEYDVVADVMVNHISRHSPPFLDFLEKGRRSEWADLFLRPDKVWPGGKVPPEDLAKIYLRKPDNPFSDVPIQETGGTDRVWTTFAWPSGWHQVDLDVNSKLARTYLKDTLRFLAEHGIKTVRLDAVGYVTKRAGTSCFFVEPDIYEFLGWIQGIAGEIGIDLLPELHAHHGCQFRLAEHGFRPYDFVLPGLVLHTVFGRSSAKLKAYLRTCPREQFTTLDCHDGIPIQPDLDGILDVDEAVALVDRLVERGAVVTRLLHGASPAAGLDAHQVNCTYYSALGEQDDVYLAARAIQLFAPGIPQVYYMGLLAGRNNYDDLREQDDRRAINRHNYTGDEIEANLARPVVQRLLKLIRFRAGYPAFEGRPEVLDTDDTTLALRWTRGDAVATLHVDLTALAGDIVYVDETGADVRLRF